MAGTLTKISKSRSYYTTYHITSRPMSCGSGYHNNDKHQFKGTNKQVKLLVFIMKELGININNEKETSFEFESPNRIFQRMMFKLCRYVRSSDTMDVLTMISECIKAGVQPQNALVLGHYARYEYPSWVRTMDIIPPTRNVRKGFKTKEEFFNRKSTTINYFFKSFRKKFRNELVDILKQGKYLEAEKYILDYE